MISLFKKSNPSELNNGAIFHCTKMLLEYRLKHDNHLKSQLIANNLEDFFAQVDTLSPKQLALTTEHYAVCLIAMFIILQSIHVGKQYRFKDFVYTIDQALPKPKGYIPVEMWAPSSYPEYIVFRISIDRKEPYPIFVIDALYDDVCAYLTARRKEVYSYLENHPIV